MIYVLAYLEFEPSIAESIHRFRSAHELERARLVPPHVTLVFGMRNTRPQDLLTLCEDVAGRVSELTVSFNEGGIVYDPFEKTHKLLLFCSTGKRRLIALHQQLYEGPHRAELNLDIPYRPHMTVATNKDRTIIERLDMAAIGDFPIAGTISALEVVELVDNTLQSFRTVPLRE